MARTFLSWLIIGISIFSLPADARADSLETVLMPGKVIEGHADLEGDCKHCHARFRKSAQNALCLDCHKEVARDVAQKQGHHGRLPEQECRACHTEHKGRAMNIAPVDEKSFDHKLTDFLLKGGHAGAKVPCRDCHTPTAKFRDAPSDCLACHRKDDTHKGSLGTQCADCHDETDWKQTRFDHGKTKFPLTGKHRDAACKDCHADPKFKGAPTACVACHRKDDDRKGHQGRFGAKCESCHTDREWKTTIFNHDRDTRYPLHGKHILASCDGCHAGFLYREKLKTACVACHKSDDDRKGHKGRFGDKCESCHTEKDWGAVTFRHDRDTDYPLRGKHAGVECGSCHTGILYREKLQTTCVACHAKDDEHKGQEGKNCESCHNERSWKDALFDHGLARFPLLGKHAGVKCGECHRTPAFKDARSECVACHERDDVHERRLGVRCETCHNARDWKAWSFDHDRQTHFRLDGGHRGLKCVACHRKPAAKIPSLSGGCASCHEEDDVHHGSFGKLCERCHVSSSFKKILPGIGIVPR